MPRTALLLVAVALLLGCNRDPLPNGRLDGGLGGTGNGTGGTGGGGGGATIGDAGAEGDAKAPSVGCAKQLASGFDHACILYDEGRVACVGDNAFGQLGNGTTVASTALAPAHGVDEVGRLAAGGNHTCALARGGLYCWGDNRASELGVIGIEQSSQPLLTAAAGSLSSVGIVQLALGSRHGCLLDQFVHGYCWGTGASGTTIPAIGQVGAIGHMPLQILQLGGGETRLLDGGRLYDVPWRVDQSFLLPSTPGAPDRIVANAIGEDHECLLKASGTVWCRGGGYPAFYAVAADFGSDVAEVAVGVGFTCARTRAGAVLCRGRNEAGQLGDGSLNARDVAVAVPGIGPAVELSLGSKHGCARLTDGSVWCWGALAGSAIRMTPARIAGPAASQTCSGVASVPLPWTATIPKSTPADELVDAVVAYGQNQCRCIFANDPSLEACRREETHLLNGCLQALAADVGEPALCLSQWLWSSVACWATCVNVPLSPADPPQCAAMPMACGERRGALRFCMRNSMLCDRTATERVGAFETCDGKADCANGFDEANCTPGSKVFRCADGSSIDPALLVSGNEDCPDGSDEWW